MSRRAFLCSLGAAGAVAAFPWDAHGRRTDESELASRLKNDPLRPQYHLMPAANWMNDPNGPIFYRGRYQMFFQYNPNGAYWGDMHWAHAVSPDMIHWQHQSVAIAPTPGGWDRDGVFSGSVVLNGDTPTAIYTGVSPADPSGITLNDGRHKWREVQCLATSMDVDLKTWKKWSEPIVARPPEGLQVTGFRDPGVWREGDDWLMTLGSSTKEKGGMVLIYRSRDLRHWEYLHPLVEGDSAGKDATNPVDTGHMWECPDFFPLADRHVLLYAAKSKVWWKTGEYRERRFFPNKEGVADFGSFYAPKTMIDRDGTRILWGWIPETRPEAEYRAAGWAGLMSLPRVMSIGADGGLELDAAPAAKLLRGKSVRVGAELSAADKAKGLALYRVRNLSAEIEAEFAGRRKFLLRLVSEQGGKFAEISYDPDRTGRELMVNEFAGTVVPRDRMRVHFLLDGSSLEVFANRQALTARVYTIPLGAPDCPLRLEVDDWSTLEALEAWEMRPISADRLTTP